MKIFKKNQIIIYVIVLMLITAGYLNYQTSITDQSLETAMKIEMGGEAEGIDVAEIGDAELVNSSDVVIEDEEEIHEEGNSNTQENSNTEESSGNQEEGEVENVKENNIQEVNNSANFVADEYFEKSKLERETIYSQMIENYENILNSEMSLEPQRQIATEEIEEINDVKNKIMICENLISIKGFEQNVIFVNEDSVNIIVSGSDIQPEEIAQIQNIISREFQVEIENIHITSKNLTN